MKYYYWSRIPGKFINETGEKSVETTWPGDVLEWYQTLYEVISKACKDEPATIITSPDIRTIIEHLVCFMPTFGKDGAHYEGTGRLGDKIEVLCDPYYPSNIIGVFKNDTKSFAHIFVKDIHS